jgi:hypothetical protein
MVTSVTKGGTQKLPKKDKIVEIYWHDDSLESSWGPLSDGIIWFSHFWGKMHFVYFSQNMSVLNELRQFRHTF